MNYILTEVYMSLEHNVENPICNIEPLLRSEDIAHILNISRSLAYQLVQRGEIPSVRIGKSVRIRPQDLEKFILNRLSTGF
jgi:excisionase family DNA binding protein